MANKSNPNTGIKIVSPDDPDLNAMHSRVKGQTLINLYKAGMGEFIVLLSGGAVIDVTYGLKLSLLGEPEKMTLFGISDQPPIMESDILRHGGQSISMDNPESKEIVGKSYLGFSYLGFSQNEDGDGILLLFFSEGWRMAFRPSGLYIEHLNRKALQ